MEQQSNERRPNAWRVAGLILAIAVVLCFAHRDAWKGYFEDDDFATFGWAQLVPLKSYLAALPHLDVPTEHARPVGYLYFGALLRTAGLNYPPWVFALQAIGVVNVVLLWLLLRSLGLGATETAIGCLFFASSSALFDGWWKPMFVYDVLCTTLWLAALLAYVHRRWVVSFVAFWLAMRTKEMAVALPAVLLCYEMALGQRNWRRVIPFFVPALVFGVYGLLFTMHIGDNLYAMRFAPPALWKSLSFYSSRLFGLPYAGFLPLLLPLVIRDRRLCFGVVAYVCGLGLYLLLPDRLFDVYLYLATTGIAVVLAALAALYPRTVLVAALLWIPWQCLLIRRHAAVTLAAANERRDYVAALRRAPRASVYVYADAPETWHFWGAQAVLRAAHGDVDVHQLEEVNLPPDQPMQLLAWNPRTRKMLSSVLVPGQYSRAEPATDLAEWQIPGGWRPGSDGYRALLDTTHVRLYYPQGGQQFAVEACGDAGTRLRTWVDGDESPPVTFAASECVGKVWPVRTGPARVLAVDFISEPAGQIRIGAFGFRQP